MNYYTKDEVAQHNTARDCWIILYGEIYNISDFMKHEH